MRGSIVIDGLRAESPAIICEVFFVPKVLMDGNDAFFCFPPSHTYSIVIPLTNPIADER